MDGGRRQALSDDGEPVSGRGVSEGGEVPDAGTRTPARPSSPWTLDEPRAASSEGPRRAEPGPTVPERRDPAPDEQTAADSTEPVPVEEISSDAPGATDLEVPRATGPAGAPEDADAAEPDPLVALVEEVRGLRADHERRATEYERIIRAQHDTIEELRNRQLQGLMKPVFQQIAQLHSELTVAEERARARDEASTADDLAYFAQSLEGVLDQFDLESVGAEPGRPFDARAHSAVLRKDTDDPALDQTIASVKRQGFRVIGQDRTLIPARVVVWRTTAPPSTPEPTSHS